VRGPAVCDNSHMFALLWAIAAILVVLWIAGFAFHVLGSFIHILLVIAIIVAIYNVVMGQRAAR